MLQFFRPPYQGSVNCRKITVQALNLLRKYRIILLTIINLS